MLKGFWLYEGVICARHGGPAAEAAAGVCQWAQQAERSAAEPALRGVAQGEVQGARRARRHATGTRSAPQRRLPAPSGPPDGLIRLIHPRAAGNAHSGYGDEARGALLAGPWPPLWPESGHFALSAGSALKGILGRGGRCMRLSCMRHNSHDSQMAPGLPRTWACLQRLKQRVDEAWEQRRLHAAMLG